MNNDNQSRPNQANQPSLARRTFLQTAAVGAAAAGTAMSRSLHAADVPGVHSGSDIIRVGLVGCGGRGSGAALDAMSTGPDVHIVAVGDLFEDSLTRSRKGLSAQKPEQFKVDDDHAFTGFDAYKQVIDSDIDVVLLASPPYYRPDHIEYAVNAGKHIFAEKPISSDPHGARRVMASSKIADEKKLNIVSGLCWRYDEGVKQTMGRILDGAIGEVVSSQSNYLASPIWVKNREPNETEMHYQCRNWYYYTWLSGDHYVEQFIHSLDKALWLHHDAPPVRAYGTGGRSSRSDVNQGHIYDHFSVVYEWADGTRNYASTRQFSGCFNETEDYVYGTEGTAKVLAHKITGKNPWDFTGNKISMYEAEHIELFNAVRGKRDRINNSEYMCRSTLMAILGREACYSGKMLTYDEVANSPMKLGPEKLDWDQVVEVSVAQPGKYKFPVA